LYKTNDQATKAISDFDLETHVMQILDWTINYPEINYPLGKCNLDPGLADFGNSQD